MAEPQPLTHPLTHPPAHRRPPAVRRRPSFDASITGLVYCSLMMFMGLAAINSQANLLFGVFGLMIGILLVSGMIGISVLRGLDVTRRLPEAATVGVPVRLTYVITNRKWSAPSLSVLVGELDGVTHFTRQPHAYLLHAAAKRTVEVPSEVVPRRRGVVTFGRYQLSTSFPFGFIKRAVRGYAADAMLIYPPRAAVDRRLIARFRSAQHVGAEVRPREGGDDEFYGVREFRTGDNPRRIYWRRSARVAASAFASAFASAGGTRVDGTGGEAVSPPTPTITPTFVAREMTRVAPPKLLILVDTYAPQDSTLATLADVERAVAMAASLADAALTAGLPVGLLAPHPTGTPEDASTSNRDSDRPDPSDHMTYVPFNRGKRQRRELLAAVARLPRNPTIDLGTLQAVASARQQTSEGRRHADVTTVLLTPGRAPKKSPLDAGGTGPGRPSAPAGSLTGRAGGMITLATSDPQALAYFRFDPPIDFLACVEPDATVATGRAVKPGRSGRVTTAAG